jgi:hypothetical protein
MDREKQVKQEKDYFSQRKLQLSQNRQLTVLHCGQESKKKKM